jgi:exopolysaccharide biosynthesis protein
VAVGLTSKNELLLVATRQPVTLARWARTLRALGARDALNLDGGASTGLFYRGARRSASRPPADERAGCL